MHLQEVQRYDDAKTRRDWIEAFGNTPKVLSTEENLRDSWETEHRYTLSTSNRNSTSSSLVTR
jgi:hypothetical protein